MKNQLIIILISYSSHILSVQDTRLVELKDTLPSQQSSDTLQAQSEKNEEQSFADRKYYIKSIMEERAFLAKLPKPSTIFLVDETIRLLRTYLSI